MSEDFRELREAVAAVKAEGWSRGRLLATGLTRTFSAEQCKELEQIERRGVYANFRADDQGRSRTEVAYCPTPDVAAYIAAANPQTIAALLAELDAARAEIERLTTLRPMSELTFADGNVLFHPAADAESASPTAEVRDVSFLTCRERSEWFNGWTPIPEAKQ